MQIKDKQILYQSDLINLRLEKQTFTNGKEEYSRDLISKDDAVAVVAYDDKHLYLIEQPREAVGQEKFLEIPAGTLDIPNETPLQCAQRELAEETGLKADNWKELMSFYSSPGYSSERITLFSATDLKPASGYQGEEKIDLRKVPLEKIWSFFDKIEDAKSLIGLFRVFSTQRPEW